MTEVMQVRELSQQRAWHRMNPTPDIESLLKQALADPNAFPVTYRESIHGQAQRSHYCHTRRDYTTSPQREQRGERGCRPNPLFPFPAVTLVVTLPWYNGVNTFDRQQRTEPDYVETGRRFH